MYIRRIFICFGVALAVSSILPPPTNGNIHPDLVCSSDTDCLGDELCFTGQCVHGCTLKNGDRVEDRCGENAYCYVHGHHNFSCKCHLTHRGNPDTGCHEKTNFFHYSWGESL